MKAKVWVTVLILLAFNGIVLAEETDLILDFSYTPSSPFGNLGAALCKGKMDAKRNMKKDTFFITGVLLDIIHFHVF